MNSIRIANSRRRKTRTATLPGLAAADLNNTQIMLAHDALNIREALNLTKHSPEMVLEVEALIEEQVYYFQILARELLPQLPEDWRIRYRLDWRTARKASWGGSYYAKWRSEVLKDKSDAEAWARNGSAISLKGSAFPENREDWYQPDIMGEYRAFHMDREIGDFSGTTYKTSLCLIAHECAHAVQYTKEAINMGPEWWLNTLGNPIVYVLNKKSEWYRGHELLFQCIYRLFRRKIGFIDSLPNGGRHTPTYCEACSKLLPPPVGRGRISRFCNSSCRIKAWREKSSDFSR